MSKKIVIIQGHPDPKDKHFCHALAKAYAEGAESAGHKVTIIEVAHIDFPLLRTQQDFDHGDPIEAIKNVQRIILEAEHLVMVYPLWFGGLPAYFKAFLEQVFRPGFAANKSTTGGFWEKLLTGRSARIVITMAMPAFIYRWYYLAHSLKSLKRNMLGFCGIGPIADTLIGMAEQLDDAKSKKWLSKMYRLGSAGK